MVLFPNCKINIGLNIVSRRPDGYHNIETVMYPIGWTDVLELVPSAGTDDNLFCSGRGVDCPPEKNLVMRAVKLMREHCEFPAVDIYLEKIIPDGAGLGGGSSDAAFTLTGLNSLFDLGLTDEQLCSMAAQLGADCPFFIGNRPVYAHGIGTDFAPADVDLSGYGIVVVKPPVSVPTAQAYSLVKPTEPATSLVADVTLPVADWRGVVKNDFEPSVFAQYPVVEAIKEMLYRAGATYASMSGSGSAVYGIFAADKLSPSLWRLFPRCDIFSTLM